MAAIFLVSVLVAGATARGMRLYLRLGTAPLVQLSSLLFPLLPVTTGQRLTVPPPCALPLLLLRKPRPVVWLSIPAMTGAAPASRAESPASGQGTYRRLKDYALSPQRLPVLLALTSRKTPAPVVGCRLFFSKRLLDSSHSAGVVHR